MSELKAILATPHPKMKNACDGAIEVYPKSEADDVIAEKDEEIARLDDLAHAHNIELLRKENLIEEKDAEIRRLKRALWLARAERAKARKNYWYVRSLHEGDKDLWSIDGSVVKYIGCIKRSNFDWLKIWSEVECKCRAKAKEYK